MRTDSIMEGGRAAAGSAVLLYVDAIVADSHENMLFGAEQTIEA